MSNLQPLRCSILKNKPAKRKLSNLVHTFFVWNKEVRALSEQFCSDYISISALCFWKSSSRKWILCNTVIFLVVHHRYLFSTNIWRDIKIPLRVKEVQCRIPIQTKSEICFLSPYPRFVHLIASIPKLFDIILSQQRELCLLIRVVIVGLPVSLSVSDFIKKLIESSMQIFN